MKSPLRADDLLSTRGRLALLLADMPGKWQDQFLPRRPAGRIHHCDAESLLPGRGRIFKFGMVPRPFDLGPMTTLANLSELPVFKILALSCWLAFGSGPRRRLLLAH